MQEIQKEARDANTSKDDSASDSTLNMKPNHLGNEEIDLAIEECSKLSDDDHIHQRNKATLKCAVNEKSAKDLRKMFHSNKIKDIIRALLKYLVNGLCLGFVTWQIIKCTTKYIVKPQGTDVHQKKASELPFPAITICGDFGEDSFNDYYKGFNTTYLRDTCG